MKRTTEELIKMLSEQIHLLEKSCRSYDDGDHLEALRIATSLRTLMHDTNKSKSLLKLLDMKDEMKWINTKLPNTGTAGWQVHSVPRPSHPYALDNVLVDHDFDNSKIYLGLVIKQVTFDGDDLVLSFKPVGFYRYAVLSSFENWWNDIVFDNHNGIKMSRCEVVKFLTNKEGGAHIDDLPDKFFNFKHREVIKYRFKMKDNTREYDSNPIFPSVRQIAYEFLVSLKK